MHQEKKMLAHISEDGTRVQTVADHLQERQSYVGNLQQPLMPSNRNLAWITA